MNFQIHGHPTVLSFQFLPACKQDAGFVRSLTATLSRTLQEAGRLDSKAGIATKNHLSKPIAESRETREREDFALGS